MSVRKNTVREIKRLNLTELVPTVEITSTCLMILDSVCKTTVTLLLKTSNSQENAKRNQLQKEVTLKSNSEVCSIPQTNHFTKSP